MGRTNIELDDALIEMAMRRYGLKTKREVVQLALENLVGGVMTREQALAMEGSGWEGDLDEIRGKVSIEELDDHAGRHVGLG
jgi:Arc/MetJ family transcription regulator